MKTITTTLLFIMSLFFLQAQTYVNPIGDLADPFIYFYNGNYYFTGTTGTNVSIKKSSTLQGLASAKRHVVFSPNSPGGQLEKYWAPEIFRYDNKWYIYYTAPINTTSTSIIEQRMHVLENSSEDPTEGTWIYKGRLVVNGADFYAIDHHFFENNGDMFVAYSGSATIGTTHPQNIYIAQLSNPWTISGSRTLISSPESDEWNVNEAPEIIVKGNKMSLIYSVEGCHSPNYRLRLLYKDLAANPLIASNWIKKAETVFNSNLSEGVYGTGHNGFFKSPSGTEHWFVYHATSLRDGDCGGNRTTRADKLEFDSENLPIFPQASGTGYEIQAPMGEPNLPVDSLNGVFNIEVKTENKVLEVMNASPQIGANVVQGVLTNGPNQKWRVQLNIEGFYTIQSLEGGLYLDLNGCSLNNDTNVGMWVPNGANCQQWSMVDVGGGYFRIIPRDDVLGHKALSVVDDNLQLSDWLNTDNQKFKLNSVQSEYPIIQEGRYSIFSKQSGKVIDLSNCSSENGANIIQWDSLGNDCQQWDVIDEGNGYYRIQSVSSSKSLDVPNCSNAIGENVRQWQNWDNDCQKWKIKAMGGGYYKVVSKTSGLALNVFGCSSDSGASIVQDQFTGEDCQLWEFVPIEQESLEEGSYRIVSKSNGKVVDLNNCSSENGANIAQWDWLDNDCQKWDIIDEGNGYYRIQSVSSSKSIDIPGCSQTIGENVHQWQNWDNDCQKWKIEYVAGGYYKIISKASGFAFDAANCSTTPGANIVQNPFTGEDCQLWEFVPIDQEPLQEGSYSIISKSNGKVVDLSNCSSENGANIIQWDWLDNDCQKWDVIDEGNGYYRIQSVSSSKSIDVPGCSQTIGENVHQWQNWDNDCQKWKIEYVTGGYYKIISKASGFAFDAANCSTTPGANIVQNPFTGEDCQLWKFISNNSSNAGSTQKLLKVIEKEGSNKGVTVYPNPTNFNLYVKAPLKGTISLELFDVSGKILSHNVVRPEKIKNNSFKINVESLESGVYLLKIRGENDENIIYRRIIKK